MTQPLNDPGELFPEDEQALTTPTQQAMAKPATTEMQNVGAMIAAAVEKGLDAAGIQALTDTYVKMADRQARQEFNAAFARFRAECPQPRKTAKSHHGTYTPLDEIVRVCDPHLDANGFSFRWDGEPENGLWRVTCTLSHIGGHSEQAHFSCPLSTRGHLGEEEKYAIANKWGQRLSLVAILGLTDTDADGDQRFSRIDASQVADLETLITDAKADRARFLKHAGVNKVEDILTEQLPELVKALEEKRRRG